MSLLVALLPLPLHHLLLHLILPHLFFLFLLLFLLLLNLLYIFFLSCCCCSSLLILLFLLLLLLIPRSRELRTQKLKSHLVRTQSLNVKPGVGQYIAIYATLTARDFFLANFYPSGPFTCTFPKPLPCFSCV